MNNRDILKKGADYLLKGGTLLSESCQTCNGLLIKYKGDIMCLNCQNQNLNNHEIEKAPTSPTSALSDKTRQENKRELIQISPEKDNLGKDHTIKETENYENLLAQIEKTIIKRTTDIDKSIYNENDTNKQIYNLKILLLYLKILKKIRN